MPVLLEGRLYIRERRAVINFRSNFEDWKQLVEHRAKVPLITTRDPFDFECNLCCSGLFEVMTGHDQI